MKKRVMTGIKPTNQLHLGNYVGAIKQVQILMNNVNYEIFLFVPNLHALTDEHNTKTSINEVMKVFLATCGSNTIGNDIIYYLQSDFQQVTFLTWFFSCCTPMGQLQRMTQFKSKESTSINSGYLIYPLLMAADILSIDAEIIPVGIDQKQHIELARDICDYFKNKFKLDLFKKPEPMIAVCNKIMSLQDPSKKMSKSDQNTKATIFLNDSLEQVTEKIKKATTDSSPMPINIVECKETRQGVYNLCLIYSEIANKSFEFIEQKFGNGNISIFKEDLINVLNDFLQNLQNKIKKITDQMIIDAFDRSKDVINKIMNEKIKLINEHILK